MSDMDRGDSAPGRVFRAPVRHIASLPIWSESDRVGPDLGHRDSLPQSSGDHVYRGHRFPSVVRDPGPPLVRMRNKGDGDGLGAHRYRFSQFSGCQGYGHDSVGALIRHISGLAVRGKLIVVGVPQDEIKLNAFPLVFGGRSIYGTLTGTPIDGEDTLAFSVLENIRPMIETFPLEQAADAYARMMQSKARFRVVLITKDGAR